MDTRTPAVETVESANPLDSPSPWLLGLTAPATTGRRDSRLWTWTLKEGVSPIRYATRVAPVDPTADPRIGVSSKCRRVRLGFPDRLLDPTSTLLSLR